MAPSVDAPTAINTESYLKENKPTNKSPLSFSPDSALLKHKHFDPTVVIGTEFPAGSIQATDILQDDVQLRDLAILISQRGVVFLRKQKINSDQQKELCMKLSKLSGAPQDSGLHVHPLTPEFTELGDEVRVISSKERIAHEKAVRQANSEGVWEKDEKTKFASRWWHSDITFEKVPSNYAILKVHTAPPTGGDTLWASAYEVYDRLSPPYRKFLEGLKAVHNAGYFNEISKARGFELRSPRGSPANAGNELTGIHPVIRTNPVTGWKGVFVNKEFTKRIIGLSKDENDSVLEYLQRMVKENHDLQVRHKWFQYEDAPDHHDMAIWDNRSTQHCFTDDYFDIEGAARAGDRCVTLGETPFFDENSQSRREALGLNPWE